MLKQKRKAMRTCPPARLPTCPPAHLPACLPAHLITRPPGHPATSPGGAGEVPAGLWNRQDPWKGDFTWRPPPQGQSFTYKCFPITLFKRVNFRAIGTPSQREWLRKLRISQGTECDKPTEKRAWETFPEAPGTPLGKREPTYELRLGWT